MIKLPHYETLAIDAASTAAGAYLEGLGKFDLASLTEEEWLDLLKTVFVTATDKVRDLVDKQEVPF